MFRFIKRLPKTTALLALVALSAACSTDQLSSPSQPVDLAMNVARAELPSVARQNAVVATAIDTPVPSDLRHSTMAVVYPSNAQTRQFTVKTDESKTFTVGDHMVFFPKFTICDPASSSYGAGTWLSSCSKLTGEIEITVVTWTDAQGRPQIDFLNALRFYKNSSNQLPAIYLRDPSAALTDFGRIDYCATATSCVNEATTDSALITQRDPATGFLFRIIRHFSGYNVWA